MTQPQPVRYSPPPQQVTRDKYVAAIIGVGIIALLFGGLLGFGLGNAGRTQSTSPQPQQSYTAVTGTVDWRGLDQSSSFVKLYVMFTSPAGTSSSAIYRDNSYQALLLSEKTYSVDVWYWTTSQGYSKCVVTPNTVTPSGTSYPQNLSC